MALNNSCLSVRVPVSTQCQYYIDYDTKQCVKNCSSSSKIPYISGGILYCYPENSAPAKSIATIDSSTFLAADGSTYVFFVLDKSIQNSQSTSLPIQKITATPKVNFNGDVRVGASVQNA